MFSRQLPGPRREADYFAAVASSFGSGPRPSDDKLERYYLDNGARVKTLIVKGT
jgi:hypothetical protein